MNDNNKKILNVVVQRKINCYSSDAYFLNLILAYPNMLPWIYENYIQLFFSSGKKVRNTNENEVFLDFFGGWTEPRKLLNCKQYDRKFLSTTDIICFIENKISDGFYLYTYIDEYYSISEGKEHYCHDISIYGYDKIKQLLHVIGFDKKGNYTTYTILYSVFRLAFESGILLSKEYDQYGGKNYLLGIAPNFSREKKYVIEPENMKSIFYDYLNNIRTIDNFVTDDPNYDLYMQPQNVYGICVYDCITEYISNFTNWTHKIDYRIFHVLYEHKKLMSDRLLYLKEELKYPISEQEIIQTNELIHSCDKARLIVLKHNIIPKEQTLSKLLNYILQISQEESKLFKQVYDKMI
ncbi:hypothetical protein C8E03_101227 [Lachnotalea glycerini]|uniref:Uncharacterized protein n=1 Tax=Lachnotalea glycerini TaxID=1763509 RepID=A0A318F131_9FIRM|nr:hypothetical protein [Lachnotalea glycerini]PXV95598.1 hypothetical protein C8E03_101227 [Lachnotalea glycerini]